jgi:putative aldouronate transport system permease protein
MNTLSTGEKIFSFFNHCFLGLLALSALYPFIYILAASLSDPGAVSGGRVFIFPEGFTFDAYRQVLKEPNIWIAYGNTLFYTVAGTLVSLAVTVCGAYPLSKKRLMGRKFVGFFVAFTMWFGAGMIPFYLLIRDLRLLNTRTGIIIAFAVTTFNMILLRTYFQSIPDSIEESATIDGANDIQILIKIFLPLSVSAITTIGLFYAVGRWNGYFWSMILLRDESKIPLQVLLKRLIVEMNPTTDTISLSDAAPGYSQETVIYSTIVVAVLPIICVYPFIQKYFVKGVMVGSIKG